MKKLVNDPLLIVEEMIEGLLLADGRLTRIEGENVVLRRDYAALAASGKVAIISGGGAGHEPAHAGYVGHGMLTAAVIGAVFTSPSVDAVIAAIRAVAGPAGVLLIIKNYTGDRLNFGLAAEVARASGIAVEMVIVRDDVALADDGGAVGRRGIAGTVLIHKVAGAAAEAGLSLAEVKAETEAASQALFSMGLGLGACIVPAAGKRGFELGDHEVEYGLGIHGESGARRGPIAAADVMLDRLLDRLIERGGIVVGDRVALLVNNLGGTAVQELSVVARHALQRLGRAGVHAQAALVGTFLTALEMPGCSVSLLKLDEGRLKRLLAPSAAGAWAPPTQPVSAIEAVSLPDDVHSDMARGAAWATNADKVRFAAAIAAVIAALEQAEARLTELDSVVGDGDIGISLSRGARAIAELTPRLDLDHPAAALRDISATLRRALGGTSGPLYAAFVLRIATGLAEAADVSRAAAWAAAFRAGVDGIQALGGGKAGDRTMLDALLPAAEAIERTVGDGAVSVLSPAVAAAEGGVEATKTMHPRLGRSSYVGDRALGHPDPGAYAVALWLRAIASVV
ncbi:dihydroxyacetone kinase subunit DhaL [Sphingomonas sp. MMS24-J13]|uniref:dihydroxyacetone kinase subunit DhaL n=1 Tax=Sphingomonas sp. MMS24-J13 TaxID=3238686 RepID=UPI00384C2A29